jgi:hypothetical protein
MDMVCWWVLVNCGQQTPHLLGCHIMSVKLIAECPVQGDQVIKVHRLVTQKGLFSLHFYNNWVS